MSPGLDVEAADGSGSDGDEENALALMNIAVLAASPWLPRAKLVPGGLATAAPADRVDLNRMV